VCNTGLQIIQIYFDGFLILLDVAPQHLLHPIKGLQVGSNIYLRHADLVIQALNGDILAQTLLFCIPNTPTRSHPSLKYDLRLK
jgi:hypothetical protein